MLLDGLKHLSEAGGKPGIRYSSASSVFFVLALQKYRSS